MMDKCPCDNCVVYAMCRTKLINMDLKYIRIAYLAKTCILLHKYIYVDSAYDPTDIRNTRTEETWKLFDIESRNKEWEI